MTDEILLTDGHLSLRTETSNKHIPSKAITVVPLPLYHSAVSVESKVSGCLIKRKNPQIPLKDHKSSRWIYHLHVHHPEIWNNDVCFRLWSQLLLQILQFKSWMCINFSCCYPLRLFLSSLNLISNTNTHICIYIFCPSLFGPLALSTFFFLFSFFKRRLFLIFCLDPNYSPI